MDNALLVELPPSAVAKAELACGLMTFPSAVTTPATAVRGSGCSQLLGDAAHGDGQ